MLASNQKLYWAFIGYKTCFDSISINNLVKSKTSFFSLYSLFARVSSCVRLLATLFIIRYINQMCVYFYMTTFSLVASAYNLKIECL